MTLSLADCRLAVATMTKEKRALVVTDVSTKKRDRVNHPLAYAKLWHSPRTSQREAISGVLVAEHWHSFILGGNRSGKSEGAAMLDVAFALGSDHPDVRRWAQGNGLDISVIQPGPGLVYNGAPTGNDSRRYVRPKIRKLCPAGTHYRAWNSDNEAEALLPNGGRIVCKTVRQGREGWQGDACHFIRFDEEPNDPEVVNEAMMRLADYSGRLCFSMTPLNGWTPLLEEHVREPSADTYVGWLHGEDNPHVPTENLKRILAKYGAHERDARARGEIVALEGRVFTDYARHLHIIPATSLPPEWVRFAGWDFGTRNPTAIVWLAHDPDDDTIHVYREHYEADRPLAWHAERYNALTEELEFLVCDAADRGARMTLMQTHGVPNVPCKKGPNSVRNGINTVAARLAPDAEGKPHLVIHDCCTALIKEIESYRWDTGRSKGDMADAPLKKADHAIDALRYALSMFERSGYV